MLHRETPEQYKKRISKQRKKQYQEDEVYRENAKRRARERYEEMRIILNEWRRKHGNKKMQSTSQEVSAETCCKSCRNK